MNTPISSYRRRYGTPLPTRDEPLAGPSPRAKKPARDRCHGTEDRLPITPPQVDGSAQHELELVARKSYDSTACRDLTTAAQIAIQADSWLPYLRLDREDYKDFAATLEQINNDPSSADNSFSNGIITPAAKLSKSRSREKRLSILFQPNMNTLGSPIKSTKDNPRRLKRSASIQSGASSNTMQQTNDQFDSFQNTQPAHSSSFTKHKLEVSPTLLRNRSQRLRRIRASHFTVTNVNDSDIRTGEIEKTVLPSGQSLPWRPPSVSYECVDGVTLSTRPKSRKELRTGLSIPEIEAQEIQKIKQLNGNAADRQDYSFELLHRYDNYADPPPPIGATHEYVRTISPRPVLPAEQHVFVDRYSRATDGEHAENQFTLPERSKWKEHEIAESKHTYRSVPEFRVDQNDSTSDNSSAESPEVRRHRPTQQQAVEMNTRTDNARSLLSTILKTFSAKSSRSTLPKKRSSPSSEFRGTDPPRISLTSSSSRTKSDTWSSTRHNDDDSEYEI